MFDAKQKQETAYPTNILKAEKAFANRLSCQWQDWKYRKIAQIEFYSSETKIGYVASQRLLFTSVM